VRSWFGERLNAVRLSRVPQRQVDFGALARVASIDLATILDRRIFASEWQFVHGEFQRLVGRNALLHHSANIGDQRALYQFIRTLRPQSVLEIGTSRGASAFYIASAIRRNAGASGGQAPPVITVDVVDLDRLTRQGTGSEPGTSPRALISNAGLADLVEFVTADSSTFMASTHRRFAFVYLDGSTAAAQVYRDLQSLPHVLDRNAVVLLHVFFPEGQPLWPNQPAIRGPWLAVRRMEAEGSGLVARPLGELPWPTKLGSRKTSLAILGRAG